MTWQISQYAAAVGGQNGGSNEKEEILREAYPPLHESISKYTTIMDQEGSIIAWLLPDLLSKRMQVRPILQFL